MEKEKKNNKDLNINTYQNKINDKNNGLYNYNSKSDFEEQPGNLTMLNTNPELINMSSNSTASEIYKNPRYKIENNKMNTSVNLPNSDKININIRSNLQNRHRNNNNNALFIKDNSEEEIKSIKDKIRKKYKSPPKDYNNNIPDINEIKNIEKKNS